jgi:hypothetical protein
MPKRSSMRSCLILLSAIWLLSGCAASTTRGLGLPPIPERDLQECQAPQPLKSGAHQEVERWAKERGFAYRECADMHKELAEKVRLRQRLEDLADE